MGQVLEKLICGNLAVELVAEGDDIGGHIACRRLLWGDFVAEHVISVDQANELASILLREGWERAC